MVIEIPLWLIQSVVGILILPLPLLGLWTGIKLLDIFDRISIKITWRK